MPRFSPFTQEPANDAFEGVARPVRASNDGHGVPRDSRHCQRADITTGSVTGTVVDQQGGALPGVSVTAVHEPTGTQYSATTDTQGRFQIPNVRVGGPYRVTVSLSGFTDVSQTGVTVSLGEARSLSFTMGLAGVSETITVTAETIFTETRAGTAENVSREALEQLPTISLRSLTDFARLSPYFNQNDPEWRRFFPEYRRSQQSLQQRAD